MPLAHADNCVYCGGDDWIPFKHWKLCASCSTNFIRSHDLDTPEPFVPTLIDKGRPSTPGPPKRKAA